MFERAAASLAAFQTTPDADKHPARDERERKARRVQKLAAYHRRMADPAFREARAAYARRQWAKGDGARRNATDRAETTIIQAYRAALPSPSPQPLTPAQQTARNRVAAKREWRRVHAAELNARRQRDRATNPQKYRKREQAYKKRRKVQLTAAKKRAAKS